MDLDSPTARLKAAAPYLALAAVFCALASQSSCAFCMEGEGTSLSLLGEFAKGAAPFVDEWHPAQTQTPLLLPLYLAYTAIAGGTNDVVSFFRLASAFVSFAVALAGYKLLARDFSSSAATAASASYLLYAYALNQGSSYQGLYATCCFLGLVAAWRSWAYVRDDDGSASTPRVLWPVASGALFALAALSNPFVIIALLIAFIVATIVATRRHDAGALVPFAWGVCGCIVVSCCYLIFLLSRSDPATLASGMASFMSLPAQASEAGQTARDYLTLLAIDPAHGIGIAGLVAFFALQRASNSEQRQPGLIALACVTFVITVAITCAIHLASTQGGASMDIAAGSNSASSISAAE